MAITIYPPNTAPTLPSTYPDSPEKYPSSSSYSDWVGSGGSSGLGPDPSWYLAVADLPATVESRSDYAHHVNELVFTAVGGETSVTLNLEAPLTLSSGYLSLQPILTSDDADSYEIFAESGGRILPTFSGAMSVTSGVFSGVLDGGGTWLANGHYFTFGSMPDAPQLQGLKILITNDGGNVPGGTVTATFVGSSPADFSITAHYINYIVPANGTYSMVSPPVSPFNVGDGTVDYLTGVVTLPCSALPVGTKIYATYGTRHKNMGDFQIPWSGLSGLSAGSGPATCTLNPMTYNANYGSLLFNDSQWLVVRNFGFNLPSSAVIKHVAFALEGGTVSSSSGEAGIQNLALLVGNKFQLPPYTQCDGDLSDNYYGDAGSNEYWGFLDLKWPGSTANDGSSEMTGSDLWDWDYFGVLSDPVSGTGFAPTGLTVADVNDAGFGFGISGNYGDTTGSADVTVKSVRLMVWYEATTPPPQPTVLGGFLNPNYPNPGPEGTSAPGQGGFRIDLWRFSASGPALQGCEIWILKNGATVPGGYTVQTSQGVTVSTGAPADSDLATIYSDATGYVPVQQPLVTDAFGHVYAYVPGRQSGDVSPDCFYTFATYICSGSRKSQLSANLFSSYPDQFVGVSFLT